MNITYVGPLQPGSTCRMRLQALLDLGHAVVPVDTQPEEARAKAATLPARVAWKLGIALDFAKANSLALASLDAGRCDVLWVDKGITIAPRTLAKAKERPHVPLCVSYSPDDMARRHNQSRRYLRSISYYDIHFTTKTFNVPELRDMGARRVMFVANAFDARTHRPMPVSAAQRAALGGRVGFIGACEEERANHMLALANAGIPVRVWGWTDWTRWSARHPNLHIENRPLWGDDYAMAISGFDISLCFLRKRNRDRQTQRSVEIPACGGFMLAERTDEHLALFEEGKEAEFFAGREELLDKTSFYLNHEAERLRIAAAGRERCIRSGYDYKNRMRWMLEQLAT